MSFGKASASISAPRRHPGGPWEQLQRHLAGWNTVFIDDGDLGTHFEEFVDTMIQIRVFWFVFVSLKLFESRFGRSGFPEQAFGIRRFAKISFSQTSDFYDFGVLFVFF